MIYKKPKWWNVLYDGIDEVQGKLLLGYVLIKKDDAFKVPYEPLYPTCVPQKINIFVVGLRDVEETHSSLSQIKLKALSTSFDISGDDYDPVVTVPEKILNNGVNINTFLPITVDVPKNKNLCPVLDCFVYDHSGASNDISDKKLLGLTTIDLSNILAKYYMTQSQRDQLEDIQENEDIVEELNKEVNVMIGGARKQEDIKEINYPEMNDDELFRHIAWELPKRKKIIPDDEFTEKKHQDEEYKSIVLKSGVLKNGKRKVSDNKSNSVFKSPPKSFPLPQDLIEPKRIILDEEIEENQANENSQIISKGFESSNQEKKLTYTQKKNLFQTMEDNNKIHLISEKIDPKNFEDDDDFIDNELSLNNLGKINKGKGDIIGLTDNKIKSSDDVFDPVSHQYISKKSIKVYSPIEDGEDLLEEKDEEKPISKGNASVVRIKTLSQKNSKKNSIRNSMHLSLSPILEDPKDQRPVIYYLNEFIKFSNKYL